MTKVAAALFTGLIVLMTSPCQAQDLSQLSASERSLISQSNDFKFKAVGFRGRRGNFRRSRFRRGGFKRHGFKRHGFKRNSFGHRGFKHHDSDKFHKFKHDQHPDSFKKHKDFKKG